MLDFDLMMLLSVVMVTVSDWAITESKMLAMTWLGDMTDYKLVQL